MEYGIFGQKIVFNHNFNDIITQELLEVLLNCRIVEFGTSFNQDIGILHECNIEKLRLSSFFNNSLDFLPNIRELTIESLYFNKNIDCLPLSLEVLELSGNFNKEIDFLPVGLKELYLGNEFDMTVDNLPNSLEIIQFGKKFKQSINNFHVGLKRIYFNPKSEFNQEILALPETLELLVLPINYEYTTIVRNRFPNINIF